MSEDPKLEFKIAQDGSVEIDGAIVESPTLAELEAPVEGAPVDPEVERLRQQVEEYEGFKPLIRGIGEGRLKVEEVEPAPTEPIPAAPEDITGYRDRWNRPGSSAIIEDMRLYAETLPEHERRAIEEDFTRFNSTYDHFERLRQPSKPGIDRELAERVIAQKEVLKTTARVVPPGVGPTADRLTPHDPGYVPPQVKRMERLKAMIRRDPTNVDLQVELAKHYPLHDED